MNMSRKFLNIKHGYKVPENYFEDFTVNHLENQIHTADNGKKKSGFKIPEGYFENFEFEQEVIFNNTTAFKKQNNSWIFVLSGLAAAVFVLIVLNLSKTTDPQNMNDLAYTEIENYLLFEDIDIATQNLNTSTLEDLSFFNATLEDEEVVEYLIETDENEFYDYE